MKVFVTGASGFIGSAIVKELILAGHEVIGLARSEASAKSIAALGAKVHRGDIQDLESIRNGAAMADGVIHTAFNHDFSKFKDNCEADRKVIEAFGAALMGSDRPLIVTSGTALVSPGQIAIEDKAPMADANVIPRIASEEAAQSILFRGVNVSIVRLSPSVHGEGDHGFVPLLITMAREKGVSAYVEGGQNRWTAVHRFDAAKLYRLALEKAAPGARYHGVAEEEIAFHQIAEVIGQQLGLPIVSKSKSEAAAHFGWFSHFAAIDCPASSKLTRERLGWRPSHPTLLEDLKNSDYFKK
jgi:nucleoside-diphosphate-sugar epimerase